MSPDPELAVEPTVETVQTYYGPEVRATWRYGDGADDLVTVVDGAGWNQPRVISVELPHACDEWILAIDEDPAKVNAYLRRFITTLQAVTAHLEGLA